MHNPLKGERLCLQFDRSRSYAPGLVPVRLISDHSRLDR